MNKNWSDYFQVTFKLPETVDEAVELLVTVLDEETKNKISSLQEDELINMHFGLGIAIRNAFGLHDLSSPLLADCQVKHPDDASEIIIKKLWNKLK